MQQRVSLITLAVRDMKAAKVFYRALGWREVDSPDGVVAGAAGARILHEAKITTGGGTHGHFADLDGHVWEIAQNPFSALGPNGEFQRIGAS